MQIKFSSKNIRSNYYNLKLSKYSHDDSVCLSLFSLGGELQARLTVCIENSEIKPGEVLIKDWSENEGVASGLMKAGILGHYLEDIPSGYVVAKKFRLAKGVIERLEKE